MPEKMVLPKELTDVLRKQLPEHVSAMLREQLEAGEQAKLRADEAHKDLMHTRDLLDDAKRQIRKEEELEDYEMQLAAREDSVSQKEATFRERVLEVKLEAAQNYGNQLEGVLSGLVRNTEWRSSVLEWEYNTECRPDGFTTTTTKPKTQAQEAK